MYSCKSCKKIILILEESQEFDVRGELIGHMFCPYCKRRQKVKIYEYRRGASGGVTNESKKSKTVSTRKRLGDRTK